VSRDTGVGGEVLSILLTIAVLIASCLLLSWAYWSRKSECMATKHDEVLCTIYAESIFR
jgi:hypothetical protein